MYTKTKLLITGIIAFVLLATIQSCKPTCEKNPDDPECADPQELITTLKVLVTDSATGALVNTFQFKDADANGTPEVFDTIRLNANATYNVEVQVWDDSKTPAENITEEVEEEKNDHTFFYNALNVNLNITKLDTDDNALPVGIDTRWVTGAAGTGQITIKLKHQPGVKDGTDAPGETDVEVQFPTIIQ